MTELRACPFCGGEAFMVAQADHPGFHRVFCHGCHVATNAHSPEAAAIAAWNRRADDWMPIETAPRDGTEVLFFAPPTGDAFPTAKQRIDRWKNGAWWQMRPGQPYTHWRPLPKGPGG